MGHQRSLHEVRREKAVARLRAGAQVFNQWRKTFKKVYLELSHVDLSGLDLRGVDLSNIRLRYANFSGADLSEADIGGANLNYSRLVDAKLCGANLRQVRMARADLTGADLNGTNLYGSARDGWKISRAQVEYCWITKDRSVSPDEPERFQDGEFEMCYGGSRFKVVFPDGIQPIDLVALPYHANAILGRFADRNLVFTGLSTVGEAALEFRMEARDTALAEDVQTFFSRKAVAVRDETMGAMSALLAMQQAELQSQRIFIDTLMNHTKASLSNSSAPSTVVHYYNVKQAGAVGPESRADHAQVNWDSWKNFAQDLDFLRLQRELKELRGELERVADRPEHAQSITAIERAEKSAREGRVTRLREHLKKAGLWTFRVATNIGVELAAEAINQAGGTSA